ncbi:MAG: hypothetical protein IJB46_05615 [Prevotella sp.]|nr:hypothetical protein [Prevotella sp.]
MYDDNNDIKKRQVEVLKEGLELQNDVNEFAKEINKGISDINNALFGNNIVQMRECAISIKRKYPLFYCYLPKQVLLCIPSIPIEDMEYGQIRTVLIAEINALRNMVDDYGLSQGIKKGLELAVKWRIEDIMKK